MAPWAKSVVIASSLVGCWAVVYGAGGSSTAWPHAFYVPIVLAALPFGVVGGVTTALGAMVLCGPLMPLDVPSGEAQMLANWLLRGGFFTAVGITSGLSTDSLRRRFTSGLTDQLWAEIELAERQEELAREPGWESRIRDVLASRSFHPVFQPIYDLDDGSLWAIEALTRFDVDEPATPDVWFDQAARVGLGVELELAAVTSALEAVGELSTDVAMTFNGSPALLCDERLLTLLDRYPDRVLIAEVTEHAIVDDYRQLSASLDRLRARGVQVAIDDAGAGFSSLRHVVRLAPDYIKLDLSLTQDLAHDAVRRPLAECLVLFAQRAGIQLVAEGIETDADLATWKELGAHAAQGYLLGKPTTLPFAPWAAAIRHASVPVPREI